MLGVTLPPAWSAAVLIVDSLALLLVHCGADVIVLGRALFVVHSFALVVILRVASLLVVCPTLLFVLCLDNRLLDGVADIVDHIITNFVGNVGALLLGGVVECGLVLGVAVLIEHGCALSLILVLGVRLLDFFTFCGGS